MAGESIAEMNSAFASARAERVNTALQNALQQKALTPPAGAIAPKASKGKPAASAPAVAGAAASAAPAPVAAATAPGDGGPSIADVQAALGEPGAEAAAEVATEADAPQGEAATEGEGAESDEGPAPELAELQELGKKKDLRALEKKLGLEEGSLGVNNGSWKAYRNRLAEVEAKEAQHVKNEEVLVAKYRAPFDLIEHAKKGDLRAYGMTIEQTTGMPIGRFIQLWTSNVQAVDPRTLELERENARLRGQGKLVEQDGTQTPAAPPAAKQVALDKANTYITSEAPNHPALRLKDGLDSVRAKWLASYDKTSKTFKVTPKAAADAVVAERRAAHEQEQWILSGKTPPKKPTTRALPRAGASEMVPREDTRTRQQKIDDAARKWQQQKARERKA